MAWYDYPDHGRGTFRTDPSRHKYDHAPPTVPLGNGVTGGPVSVRDGGEAKRPRTNLKAHGLVGSQYNLMIAAYLQSIKTPQSLPVLQLYPARLTRDRRSFFGFWISIAAAVAATRDSEWASSAKLCGYVMIFGAKYPVGHRADVCAISGQLQRTSIPKSISGYCDVFTTAAFHMNILSCFLNAYGSAGILL